MKTEQCSFLGNVLRLTISDDAKMVLRMDKFEKRKSMNYFNPILSKFVVYFQWKFRNVIGNFYETYQIELLFLYREI